MKGRNVKYIDLSHRITPDLPVHPYDREISLVRDKTLEENGFNNSRLEMGMHGGTHIDVPMHLTGDPRPVSDWEPGRFAGRGCLLDVRGEDRIGYRPAYEERIWEGDAVILLTGRSSLWGEKEYFRDYPLVGEELAALLVRKKIALLGMDLPSPDAFPFPVHKMLFAGDIPIMENMTGLERLIPLGDFEILAFPLKIQAEGSPVRAVARYEEKR